MRTTLSVTFPQTSLTRRVRLSAGFNIHNGLFVALIIADDTAGIDGFMLLSRLRTRPGAAGRVRCEVLEAI